MAASGDLLIATATTYTNNATQGSTTATGYTTSLTTAGTCGVAFVAPPSGKVTIHFHTAGFGTGTGSTKTAVRVGTTSSIGGGSTVYAATDDNMILFAGTAVYGIGNFAEVSGLTAGDTYNACMAHNVDAGTGQFLRRNIKVVPDL